MRGSAIVDEDHGTQAVRVQEAFRSVEANVRTFVAVPYTDEVRAREDVREGRLEGALIIPPQFSRRFYAGENPQLGMVVDNSDQFMASSLEDKMQELVTSLNQPEATAKRISSDVALEIDRAVSVRRISEVPAAGLDHAGDVCLGDDRRRDVVHRRQGARGA